VIPGERGSGEVIINGAAAHLAHVGDKVIIAAYTQRDSAGLGPHECSVVIPDDQNRPAKTFRYVADLANRSFAVEGLDDD
jgi:aspartate 1-decarboxylase